MNELKVFQNSEFGELGVVMIDGKEHFPATHCAKILGYKNPQETIRNKCKGVRRILTPTNGGAQEINYIPEGDLYRLIISSKLPAAERFERWVFDEVLPEIRRTGGYGGVNLEEVIARAVTMAVGETVKALRPMLERPAPEMLYETFEPDVRLRRSHSIISQLDPMLRTEVDDMLLSQKYTYEEVRQFLASQGIAISIAAIGTYKQRLYRR